MFKTQSVALDRRVDCSPAVSVARSTERDVRKRWSATLQRRSVSSGILLGDVEAPIRNT